MNISKNPNIDEVKKILNHLKQSNKIKSALDAIKSKISKLKNTATETVSNLGSATVKNIVNNKDALNILKPIILNNNTNPYDLIKNKYNNYSTENKTVLNVLKKYMDQIKPSGNANATEYQPANKYTGYMAHLGNVMNKWYGENIWGIKPGYEIQKDVATFSNIKNVVKNIIRDFKFKFDKPEFIKDYSKELDILAGYIKYMKQKDPQFKVVLHAGASSEGTNNRNAMLSIARGYKLIDELKRRGITDGIELKAEGELKASKNVNPDDRHVYVDIGDPSEKEIEIYDLRKEGMFGASYNPVEPLIASVLDTYNDPTIRQYYQNAIKKNKLTFKGVR